MHKEVDEVDEVDEEDAKWEELFEEFEEYKTQYDTAEVPSSHQIRCNWVRTQRDAYRANSMKGWTQMSLESHWLCVERGGTMDGIIRTTSRVGYKKVNNHTKVPRGYKDHQLGNWVNSQRVN